MVTGPIKLREMVHYRIILPGLIVFISVIVHVFFFRSASTIVLDVLYVFFSMPWYYVIGIIPLQVLKFFPEATFPTLGCALNAFLLGRVIDKREGGSPQPYAEKSITFGLYFLLSCALLFLGMTTVSLNQNFWLSGLVFLSALVVPILIFLGFRAFGR